jgi:hypothetical protein
VTENLEKFKELNRPLLYLHMVTMYVVAWFLFAIQLDRLASLTKKEIVCCDRIQ